MTTNRQKKSRLKGITMVLGATFLWGLLATFSQMLMQDEALPPNWLVTFRLLGSGLILLLWMALQRKPWRKKHDQTKAPIIWEIWRNKKDAFHVAILGIIGFLGVQYSYYLSIQTGNAVTTTLLHFSNPIIVMLWVAFRTLKWPSRIDILSLFAASIGIFLLMTNGSFEHLTVPMVSFWMGLVSAIAGAFYLIQPVKLIKKYGASLVVAWGMTIGGIVMSFFAPPWEMPVISIRAWALLLYVTFAGTLLGFILYLGSLKYIRSFESGILSCVEPLVAFVSSYFILSHTLGMFEAIGGLLILITVVMITLNQEKNKPKILNKKIISESSSTADGKVSP